MKHIPKNAKIVPGKYYGTPKELWNFRTRKSDAHPHDIAEDFLREYHRTLGLSADLAELNTKEPKVLESLGAYHVIFQQKYAGVGIHRAYATVHMDGDGRVYLAKNRTVPKHLLPKKIRFDKSEDEAEKKAVKAVKEEKPKEKRPLYFHSIEKRWYPVRKHLSPSYRVRLERNKPQEEWVVYVRASTGTVIDYFDNLAYAKKPSFRTRGTAWVFDPSPVTKLGDHDRLVDDYDALITAPPPARAYDKVRLYSLRGNKKLEGKRVSTSRTDKKHRISNKYHRYDLRSDDKGFEEVMAYYHLDAAIRRLEDLGYRGRLQFLKLPIRVDVNGTDEDNSWYSAWNRQLTFGLGQINDAEDGELIVHELGHAILDAIVPNWGASREAKAMGEGFGDYFAASFFYDKKPERYRDCVMTWNGLFDGLVDEYDPPCQRFLNHKVTTDNFVHRKDWEHANGTIWSAALWDIRRRVGRDVADTIIIESHFQLDGYTKFAKGARAIIDADRNLYKGRHRDDLIAAFRKRKIAWNK